MALDIVKLYTSLLSEFFHVVRYGSYDPLNIRK